MSVNSNLTPVEGAVIAEALTKKEGTFVDIEKPEDFVFTKADETRSVTSETVSEAVKVVVAELESQGVEIPASLRESNLDVVVGDTLPESALETVLIHTAREKSGMFLDFEVHPILDLYTLQRDAKFTFFVEGSPSYSFDAVITFKVAGGGVAKYKTYTITLSPQEGLKIEPKSHTSWAVNNVNAGWSIRYLAEGRVGFPSRIGLSVLGKPLLKRLDQHLYGKLEVDQKPEFRLIEPSEVPA
ncbi:hypothetical protein [Haloprofundus salilacus]|uniref:hypothetical protein n=1 Tax=Haloprofundus salilacus TaxID=2876190 RepID=UPI001CCF4AD0|nr:hypothetical protein [Haloprofundus salilacus]